jgi:hypothetical protein
VRAAASGSADAAVNRAALAARLKGAVDLDTIREELADVVQTTLEPASVWVWTQHRVL